VVIADNVVVFGLQEDYLTHVRECGKYSSSTLHRTDIEYSLAGRGGAEAEACEAKPGAEQGRGRGQEQAGEEQGGGVGVVEGGQEEAVEDGVEISVYAPPE
jgi:hypothetical protein